jgi:hypothetical protein
MANKIIPAIGPKSFAELAAEFLTIEAEEAKEAGRLGYMARALVQASMPHSQQPGNEYIRHNGNFSLSMLAPSDIGLPFGVIPRLVMVWVSTEVVRTKQRQIIFGDNMSDFMRALKLLPTGGRWGTITRLKDQMKRLLACSITCIYDDKKRFALRGIKPVEDTNLWWNPIDPEQKSLWESTLTLSQSFFEEITTAPVPLRMSTVEALANSSLALISIAG